MSGVNDHRQTRRQFVVRSSLLGVGASGLAACGGGGNGATSEGGRSGRPGETLFIAGFQWGPPNTFNPFAPQPAWPSGQDSMQLLYETLLRFNMLNGDLEPGLATELQTPDENTMVLPLQEDAKWQDGKPITADDVVYTFELAQRNPEVFYAEFWDYATGITKEGDYEVSMTLNPERYNPGMLKSRLTRTWILPKHIWEPIEESGESLAEQNISEPVGSGPYQIEDANQQQVSLVRFDDYWGQEVYGGLAKPKYIVHPIFKSNEDGNLAFEQAELDISQQFAPRLWEMWEKKDLPVSTWYKDEPYHVPGGMPMLVINTTLPGLDDPRVRRALAYAIDYADIAAKAMSRYSVPANSSLILPAGAEEAYFDEANVAENGWSFAPDESKRILEEEVGATQDSDGYYALPDGTKLGPWKVQCPTGWTDWMQALRIVETNAQANGFDITTEFPQQQVVTDAVQNGSFELALWGVASVRPATPWERFRDVLDDRGVPAVGERAFWNFGRFSDPAVADLLDEVASVADDEAAAKPLYTELDTIFMQNAPMVPLMYRPQQFFEFHESNWRNFPNEDNDYAPPAFQDAGNAWLYEIERVSDE